MTGDFGDSASTASPVRVGVVGNAPCRALRDLNSSLNLDSAKKFTGTMVDFKGHGNAFAVLFETFETSPQAGGRVEAAKASITACIAEVKADGSRTAEFLHNLPSGAVGAHMTENGNASDYVYELTRDKRLLVVGEQYNSKERAPMSPSKLLATAGGRVSAVSDK